jgi:glycosyltransferase involved in cell wall biosynthesis
VRAHDPGAPDARRRRGAIVNTPRLRVAVIADYAEERWPSMDLVADMLMSHLATEHAETVDATLIRPVMPARLTRGFDRLAARFFDYPRVLAALPAAFDVYHLVDHSYAHLLHGLPSARTLVTCHDLDTFRAVLQPDDERRSLPFRLMTRRILSGLRLASHVACDSEATRGALMALAGFPEERLSVIPNGTDTGGEPDADAAADVEAARMLGPRHFVELLHVGSTIPRKRIDLLLDIFAGVRKARPEVRLTRVGGPFTAEQRVRARDHGVLDAIHVLPFVDRATLAAVYRRSALALLPSDREGFGLPIVEALACGTPMVASDIPVLREIGSDAVTYCPVEASGAWVETILRLLRERETGAAAWQARRAAGLERAAEFSWSRYTDGVVARYRAIAGRPAAEPAVT